MRLLDGEAYNALHLRRRLHMVAIYEKRRMGCVFLMRAVLAQNCP